MYSRDYSNQKFKMLKSQIEQIKYDNFFFLTDAIGDLWYGFTNLIGLLRIEKYANDISSYHKKVLDQHNTSIEKLEKIFTNVRTVDDEWWEKQNQCNDSLNAYNSSLQELIDILNPKTYTLTLTGMAEGIGNFKIELELAKKNYKEVYDYASDSAYKNYLIRSATDLGKDALDFVGNVIKFVTTGDEFAFYDALYSFETGLNDLGALTNVTLGWSLSKAFKDDTYRNFDVLEETEKRVNAKGFSGMIEVEFDGYEQTENVVHAVKGVESVEEIASFTNDIMDMPSNFKKDFSVLTDKKSTDIAKVDVFTKKFGVTLVAKKGDTDYITKLNEYGKTIGNIKTGYNWVNTAIESDINPGDNTSGPWKVTKFKTVGVIKDGTKAVNDFAEEINYFSIDE